MVYMLILAARYRLFGNTPQELTYSSIIGYIIILILFVVAGRYRRKQLGGTAELREIFGTLFIVILVTELCFTVFNYIYLWYIDPGYLDRLTESTLNMLRRTGAPATQIQSFEADMAAQKQSSFGLMLFGFARAVVFDSLAGLIIAFALKRKNSA